MKTKEEQSAFDAAVAQVGARPVYSGTFDDQVSGIFDKIANREKFNYDVNADPLYQTYKDQYIQGGKLAMKDTMGQAAALTGGYGSSYGQQVGQQAYDAYLKSLSAAIPELYGMALDKYNKEGDDLMTQYGLLADQRDNEYKRWRNDVGDWENERAYQQQLADQAYARQKAEDDTAYARQQQSYANLYALIKASGYSPSDEELAAAGMTRQAAQALQNEYTRATTPVVTSGGGSGGSSGGSSGGGGRSSGGGSSSAQSGAPNWWNAMSDAQRRAYQAAIGTAADGIWGPNTRAASQAADGLTGTYGGGGGTPAATGGTPAADSTASTASTANNDAYAYLNYLRSQGYSDSSQVIQSFARAHGITLNKGNKGNGGR